MLARFLIEGPIVPGIRVDLTGDELHHASRVVRVRTREKVEVFDGKGNSAGAVVTESQKSRVEVEIGSILPSREAPIEIRLAAALIAPDKFELVLQKGCELGVSRFIPMETERVETRVDRVKGKRERWERILLEATKQCGRTVLPRLDDPVGFAEVIDREPGLILFDADERADRWPEPPVSRLTLLIGPEGGLTAEEIEAARDRRATICSLGPRRLRAETAAIVAVALAESRYGDL